MGTPKKKTAPKKTAKKRASKYDKPLVINGSFLDVINAAVAPIKKK